MVDARERKTECVNASMRQFIRERTRMISGDVMTKVPPRLLFLLVHHAKALELRKRRRAGNWRCTCPVDSSHQVTLTNTDGKPGVALTCHGVTGSDSPGHSLIAHRRADGFREDPRFGFDLGLIPWPCKWCGCPEAKVLQALGARSRDKFRQDQADGPCKHCGAPAYRVGRLPLLCLGHLCDAVGFDRAVLFGTETR